MKVPPKKIPSQPEGGGSKTSLRFLYILAAIWLFFLLPNFFVPKMGETIPYSQLLEQVEKKTVKSVQIRGDQILATIVSKDGSEKNVNTIKVDDPTFIENLKVKSIPFEAVRPNNWSRDIASWVLPIIVMFGLWWFILGRMGGMAQGQLMSIGKAKAKVYVEKAIRIRFDDVAGVEEAKAELQEVVEFLKNPEKYSRLGGRIPKGLLLVGPPGTGKTLLARAVAGEAGVAFFSINGSEFVELYVGLGAARVRDLFEQARNQIPCIIFIDELDALGKARGITAITGANEEKEQTLNQLLAELDGFDPSQGVVLLAATNRPEILDPALLRSGRFDRQIIIDKPDRRGRADIIKIHLKKIKVSPKVNVDHMAAMTAGFSGADLENLVNEAALTATRRGADRVETPDFTAALERIVGGLERKSRILTPGEKKRVGLHELGHATVSLAINLGETIHKVSIIPRGVGALGYTMRRPTEDRYLMSKKELEQKLAVLLGGRASELTFFGDCSTGAADDLDKATEIARTMVTRYGMSEKLGLMTYDQEVSPFLGGHYMTGQKPHSEETAKHIDQECLLLMSEAFKVASQLIQQHRGFIDHSIQVLLDKETLDEAELCDLWTRYSSKSANISLIASNMSGVVPPKFSDVT